MIDPNRLPCDRSPKGTHNVTLGSYCSLCGEDPYSALSGLVEGMLDVLQASREPDWDYDALRDLATLRIRAKVLLDART